MTVTKPLKQIQTKGAVPAENWLRLARRWEKFADFLEGLAAQAKERPVEVPSDPNLPKPYTAEESMQAATLYRIVRDQLLNTLAGSESDLDTEPSLQEIKEAPSSSKSNGQGVAGLSSRARRP